MTQQSNRLGYIDCIRGFSMLMVVYHHLLYFALQHYGVNGYHSSIDDIVITFRMPLFFFVSGFVSYKIGINWTKELFTDKIKKKLHGQFIPTFVILAVFCLTHEISYIEAIEMPSKSGYWFTYVSFIVYSSWAFVAYTLYDIRRRWYLLLSTIVIIATTLIYLVVICDVKLEYLSHILSIHHTAKYALFFYLGMACKHNLARLNQIISNKWASFVILLWAIHPITIPNSDGIINVTINTLLIGLPRVLMIYIVFYYWRDFLDKENFFCKSLKMIGKHTLEIYFIHYFLLFRIDPFSQWLTNLTNDSCVRGSSSTLIPELLIVLLSCIICYVCIFIKRIVDTVPIASTLCFGPSKEANNRKLS